MKYTIEGFSQTEAIKFRRIEIVKDSKGNDKEKVVTLDCTDLVILRWFVDFYPNMMKVDVGGRQYAWVSYNALISDMPLLGFKKAMLALRFKKLVSFGILSHHTVKNGGTFSCYGFGPSYMRLVDSDHGRTQDDCEGTQNISEGVPNKFGTPTQNISEQKDSSTKDPSTREQSIGAKPRKSGFTPPTVGQVAEYVKEKGYHFDPEHFHEYYSASNWHLQGGKKISSWKQCCSTWEKRWRSDGEGKASLKGRFSEYREKSKAASDRQQSFGFGGADEGSYDDGIIF